MSTPEAAWLGIKASFFVVAGQFGMPVAVTIVLGVATATAVVLLRPLWVAREG